jgi:rubredoxin
MLLLQIHRIHIYYAGYVWFMYQYRCTKCGYVYSPEGGDYTQGIPAKTAFEDLPDTWVCPRCRVGKEYFVKME